MTLSWHLPSYMLCVLIYKNCKVPQKTPVLNLGLQSGLEEIWLSKKEKERKEKENGSVGGVEDSFICNAIRMKQKIQF